MSPVVPTNDAQTFRVLELVLGTADARPSVRKRQVTNFLDYQQCCAAGYELGCVEQDGRIVGACYGLVLPGRTALLLVPPMSSPGFSPEATRSAVERCLERLGRHRLHFIQALSDTADVEQDNLLTGVGFRPLTRLQYLARSARYPWVEPPATLQCTWQPYSAAQQSVFEKTLRECYAGSLDCPELTDLRPLSDALESHQATGPFDPALWQLLRVDDEIVGCLLLSRLLHMEMLEIVYVGVAASHRGRRFGSVLLYRALELCREVGRESLTLVVDVRNKPALRLYEAFNFASVGERTAYLSVPTDS